MEDKIQINGEWYIRAKSLEDGAFYKQEEPLLDPENLVFSEEVCYENRDFCWTASRVFRDKDAGTHHDDIDIQFTDKRIHPWKEELWDHNGYLRGVLNRNPDSMEYAIKTMGSNGTDVFIEFLKKLVELGWLKTN